MTQVEYLDLNTDARDLIDFAESMLQSPLHDWQKDMLICLHNGGTYIAGRTMGKQQIINIHKEWLESLQPDKNHCASEDVTFTYEQLMST